jgi:hypothetical protein
MKFPSSYILLLLKPESKHVPDPVDVILLEDVLATVTSRTAIIKIDVQGYECKVKKLIYNFPKEKIFILKKSAGEYTPSLIKH